MTTNNALRIKILEMYYAAGAGHIACSLSCIDLLYGLFFLRKPHDRIILSKGHAAVALYACLHHFGELTDEDISTFYAEGSRMTAHPVPYLSKSVPFATGSLGHGLPVGAGMALAKKHKKEPGHVFVLMSDGETNEGTTWETAHFARAHQLDNLVAVIDKNGIQGFDYTDQVLGDTSTTDLWESMGFHVMQINGHHPDQIRSAIAEATSCRVGKPLVVIAETIKGKGVSFMENTIDWHYRPMSEEQYTQAIEEIANYHTE